MAQVVVSDQQQQMEEIARRVFQEQADSLRREILEGELGRFRREFEVQMERVWEAIHSLAEAQRRTEERVTRLEAAVERLAEAQARTEERVTRLETAMERLEATVQSLADTVGQLARQVGHLSNLIGADLEVDAEEILTYTLKQKGYRPVGPAYPVELDGEVDVALPLESPDGERLWALVEAKTRVRQKEVEKWSKRLKSKRFLRRLAEARIEKPYMAYIFGLRIYPEVIATAEEAGIGVLDFRGERTAAVVRS